MLWDRKSIHTIHCFGDSLTAGYGALPGEGWVEVLAKRHPKVEWYNHGQCGALTEDILDALEGTAALARTGKASSSWAVRMTSSVVSALLWWKLR